MTADVRVQAYETETVLYMAIELSDRQWPYLRSKQSRAGNPPPSAESGADRSI